jgi:thiol:disulfide interchange protein DsbD
MLALKSRFTLPVPQFHRVMTRILFALASLIMLLCAVNVQAAEDEYLDPEAAFKFSARMVEPGVAEVHYAIADGYYMYRERVSVKVAGAKLGKITLPAGKVKFDETFQKNVETYRHELTFKVQVEGAGPFTLTVTSQGCADKGLCYAPMDSEAKLSSKSAQGLLGAIAAAQKENAPEQESPASAPEQNMEARFDAAPAVVDKTAAPTAAEQQSDLGRIESSLKSGKFLSILPLFFLLGLGLSFTPCVLPMVPILSSIIVGECAVMSRGRGFLLAVAYSLGMAIVYTALGVTAGLIGEGLAAMLQNPWVLGTFGLLMVALSLSMFGVYQLQVPSSIQSKLTHASGKHGGGKFVGAFIMGAFSALIVGPCVAAPLAGALVYISQTRDMFIGGSALFAMAVGMSVPLLLVGISAGSLLPRAGGWMNQVKQFFGVLMLAVALWMVSPVLPAWLQIVGWTALGLGYGSYLVFHNKTAWVAKAIGLAFIVFGMVQMVGLLAGGRDPLAPLAQLGRAPAVQTNFQRIKTTAELDTILQQAAGKPVMLDFYADWCVSCKEMEKLTFIESRVHAQLAGVQLLQVDVTANSADDKSMLKRFGLFGPPGIIFFGKDSKEVPGSRVVGYQDADKFLKSLEIALR